MGIIDVVFDILSKPILPFRLQLFEWSDLSITPEVIKHRCQETLTAQWTHRLPYIQDRPPAELAGHLIQQILSNIADIETTPYTVIDFCSGAGGPIPLIERTVNNAREARNQRPIPFRMSDLHPNLDRWIEESSRSEYLSFIPQPVDAANPPAATITRSAVSGLPRSEDGEVVCAHTKTIHLFCLSFHHFDDEAAKAVLESLLSNSDCFAVIELQDRSIGSVMLLALEFALLFLVTIFWFWDSWSHLLLTYWIPLLPAIHTWDGVVSCLRTRTFREMSGLVDQVLTEQKERMKAELVLGGQPNGRWEGRGQGKWTLSYVRQRHTRPFGYMTAVVGIRDDVRKKAQ